MKQDIAALLAGNAGVLSLYAEDRWLGSALCPEKVSAAADAEKLLERCWQKQEPKEKLLAQLSGSFQQVFFFWKYSGKSR